MIHQLIYHSRFAGTGSALSTLHSILSVSQAHNGCDGITGFLIFDKTSFVQILEGEADAVRATCARIMRDPRHYGMTILAQRQVTRRDFPDWSMGGFLRSPEVRDIYLRHGLDDGMEATALRAVQVIALARDLMAFEQSRGAQRVIDVAQPRM